LHSGERNALILECLRALASHFAEELNSTKIWPSRFPPVN